MLRKRITVITNEEANPKQYLTISGKVERLYTLTPRRIRLVGPPGGDLKQTVTLVTQEEHPLKLLEVRAKKGEDIQYALSEKKEGKINRYALTVECIRKDMGRFIDTIYLKTDNEIQPQIEIPIYGYIKELPDKPDKKDK